MQAEVLSLRSKFMPQMLMLATWASPSQMRAMMVPLELGIGTVMVISRQAIWPQVTVVPLIQEVLGQIFRQVVLHPEESSPFLVSVAITAVTFWERAFTAASVVLPLALIWMLMVAMSGLTLRTPAPLISIEYQLHSRLQRRAASIIGDCLLAPGNLDNKEALMAATSWARLECPCVHTQARRRRRRVYLNIQLLLTASSTPPNIHYKSLQSTTIHHEHDHPLTRHVTATLEVTCTGVGETRRRLMRAKLEQVQVQAVQTSKFRSWILSSPKFFSPESERYCANLFLASAKAANLAFIRALLRSRRSKTMLWIMTAGILERALSRADMLLEVATVSCRVCVACEPVIVQGLVLQLQTSQMVMEEVEQLPVGILRALKAAMMAVISVLTAARAMAAVGPFPVAETEKITISGVMSTLPFP